MPPFQVILEGSFIGLVNSCSDADVLAKQLAPRIYKSGKRVSFIVIDSHSQKVGGGDFSV